MTEQAGEQAPQAPPSADGTPESTETAAAGAEPAADPWAPFDAVLQEFAAHWPVGAGTFWTDTPTTVAGRFMAWSNTAGWPCTVRLVREPRENAVVVLVEGPPLPGGRPRQVLLGQFGGEVEAEALRIALAFGYAIGETWGPREEPAGAEPPSS
jgi:hypothetical protein